MALNLNISKEEIESWILSEEEMAEKLIEMDLIDGKAYKKYKEDKKMSKELDQKITVEDLMDIREELESVRYQPISETEQGKILDRSIRRVNKLIAKRNGGDNNEFKSK